MSSLRSSLPTSDEDDSMSKTFQISLYNKEDRLYHGKGQITIEYAGPVDNIEEEYQQNLEEQRKAHDMTIRELRAAHATEIAELKQKHADATVTQFLAYKAEMRMSCTAAHDVAHGRASKSACRPKEGIEDALTPRDAIMTPASEIFHLPAASAHKNDVKTQDLRTETVWAPDTAKVEGLREELSTLAGRWYNVIDSVEGSESSQEIHTGIQSLHGTRNSLLDLNTRLGLTMRKLAGIQKWGLSLAAFWGNDLHVQTERLSVEDGAESKEVLAAVLAVAA